MTDPRYHVSINNIRPPKYKWIWLESCSETWGKGIEVRAYVAEDDGGWNGWREGVDQKSFPETRWLKGIWRQKDVK